MGRLLRVASSFALVAACAPSAVTVAPAGGGENGEASSGGASGGVSSSGGTTGGSSGGMSSGGGSTSGSSGGVSSGGGTTSGSSGGISSGGGSTGGASSGISSGGGSTGGASSGISSGGGGTSGTSGGSGQTSSGFPGSACAPRQLAPALHAHADEATGQFLVHYWQQSSDYLRSCWGGGCASTGPTGYWTFAQGLDAVLDAASREGGFQGTIATFFNAAAGHQTGYSNGFSSDYYDDENWMALALLRAYDYSGDGAYLQEAEKLYGDIEAAWDTSCCGATPGGIWWDNALAPTGGHTQKATASNAGPVITAVRLAARTGAAAYLSFAEKVYGFWRGNFVNAKGQVADDVTSPTANPPGVVRWWPFTYDNGLMVGAALALHEATGHAAYLADARTFAAFLQESRTEQTGDGPVLDDGTNQQCTGDCEQFKGIAYRYLDDLAGADAESSQMPLLAACPSAVWDYARGAGDLFASDWAGPPVSSADTPAETSALMALNLGAARAGQYPGRTFPANHLQAEEGQLNGVGLEATHAGYEGFGYVAGWGSQGQSVVMRWNVPYAGDWRFTYHYSAGAGAAVRELSIDGKVVNSSLGFPATGAWDNWSSVHGEHALAAGPLEIKIGYPAGSSGFLNLDEVIVQPVPRCAGLPGFPVPSGPFNQADCCGVLPELSWSAAAGAVGYDVVIDGALAGSTAGTSLAPGALSPGVHRWYVEAVNGCGGNFSPEQELTVSPVPTEVSAPSPADGATFGGTSLSWIASAAGSGFDVRLDGHDVCSSIAGTTCTLAAPPASGRHLWRVFSHTGCGGVAGPPWTFTTP